MFRFEGAERSDLIKGALAISFMILIFLYPAIVPSAGVTSFLVPSVLWLLLFALLWSEVSGDKAYTRRLLPLVPLLVLVRVGIDLLMGAVVGFGGNVATVDLTTILTNIFRMIPFALGSETMRVYLLKKVGRENAKAVLGVAAVMSFITFSPYKYLFLARMGLTEGINFAIRGFIPMLATNTFLTQLAAWGGVKPALSYSLIFGAYLYLMPIVPLTPWYVTALIATVVPLAQLIIASSSLPPPRRRRIPRGGKELITTTAVLLAVAVGVFAVFLTGSRIMLVTSGSMEPTLRPGDIVLTTPTTDIQIGDVIAYASAADPIIHRVVSIVVEDGNVTYRTKGDANNAPDPFIITKEAVIGELRFTIPYIGLPLLYGAMVLGGLPNLVTVILLTVFFLHFVSVNKEVIRNRRK